MQADGGVLKEVPQLLFTALEQFLGLCALSDVAEIALQELLAIGLVERAYQLDNPLLPVSGLERHVFVMHDLVLAQFAQGVHVCVWPCKEVGFPQCLAEQLLMRETEE